MPYSKYGIARHRFFQAIDSPRLKWLAHGMHLRITTNNGELEMQFHSQPPTFAPSALAPRQHGALLQETHFAEALIAHEPAAAARRLANLTLRQLVVLARLAEGKPNKTIARDLGIERETVKKHVSAVLERLHVANRTQATLLVYACGGRSVLLDLIAMRECETTFRGEY